MTDDELIAAARAAQAKAYAPYSRFRVGAALVADGKLYEGANVENASYGLSICAERAAAVRAVVDGARRFEAIAVASDISPPAPPCGMCLQTLAEFAPDPRALRVILGNGRETRSFVLADLLPYGFGPQDLQK